MQPAFSLLYSVGAILWRSKYTIANTTANVDVGMSQYCSLVVIVNGNRVQTSSFIPKDPLTLRSQANAMLPGKRSGPTDVRFLTS